MYKIEWFLQLPPFQCPTPRFCAKLTANLFLNTRSHHGFSILWDLYSFFVMQMWLLQFLIVPDKIFDKWVIRKAVFPSSNSYYGELKAIAFAVEHTVILSTSQQFGHLHIFSDCHSALLTLSTSEPSKNYAEMALQTRRNLKKLEEKGTNTTATWFCGHAEIQENDLTDTHAKTAATEAYFLPLNQFPISLSEAKEAIKKCTLPLCQKSWTNNNTRAVYLSNLYDTIPIPIIAIRYDT